MSKPAENAAHRKKGHLWMETRVERCLRVRTHNQDLGPSGRYGGGQFSECVHFPSSPVTFSDTSTIYVPKLPYQDPLLP
jgi:hypothetical protein